MSGKGGRLNVTNQQVGRLGRRYNGLAMKHIQSKAFVRGLLSVFWMNSPSYYRYYAHRHIQSRELKPYWNAVGDYLRTAMKQMDSEVVAHGQEKETELSR